MRTEPGSIFPIDLSTASWFTLGLSSMRLKKKRIVMLTIGKLSKEFGLSRTTLLYYDAKGLLVPSGRSPSNYRLYSETDRRRLADICRYRDAGLSLQEIGQILESSGSSLGRLLEQRLSALNREISILRNQQKVIATILKDRQLLKNTRFIDRESWSELLEKAGLDQQARQKWHLEFETMSAEAHRDFLEQLGFSDMEINAVRQWALDYHEK